MSDRREYRAGDIVRATETFSEYYLFEGHRYVVTGVQDKYVVELHVHSDDKLGVSVDYLEFVRHACMFGGE